MFTCSKLFVLRWESTWTVGIFYTFLLQMLQLFFHMDISAFISDFPSCLILCFLQAHMLIASSPALNREKSKRYPMQPLRWLLRKFNAHTYRRCVLLPVEKLYSAAPNDLQAQIMPVMCWCTSFHLRVWVPPWPCLKAGEGPRWILWTNTSACNITCLYAHYLNHVFMHSQCLYRIFALNAATVCSSRGYYYRTHTHSWLL